MDSIYFPIYSYRVFEKDDLVYNAPELRGDIIRYDYFNLTRLDITAKQDFLKELYTEYKETRSHGFSYRDFILNRYYFKEFVIRESTDSKNQTRFYKYSVSTWDEGSKAKEIDDRILTVDIYTEFEDGSFQRDISYKVKTGHKEEVISYINDLLKKHDDHPSRITEENLYVIPLYYTLDTSINGSYSRISDAKNDYKPEKVFSILNWVPQSLSRFILFNLYMLNRVEEERNFDFVGPGGSIISNTIVDYIKNNPTEDKKVLIYTGSNVSIKIHPDRKNIYNHDNTIIRTLNDYKHQVHGHYQHYWVGSVKDGTRKRIEKWKAAYNRNSGKKYRVTKQYVEK